jgi:branched-chain amino acid transport system ATP-binding protein
MSAPTAEPTDREADVGAPLLSIRGLTAGYGALTVLRDVSLEVRPGEIVSLLGPNGAGKTTTLLACSGLVRVTGGDIEVVGRSVRGVAPHNIARRGMAHIPGDRSLWPTLTVDEHLRLTSKPGALDVYDLFPEIARMKNKRAGLMSGGEQQMLTLARALVTKPQVLLVDEMSMGLAPVIVERLFATLRSTAAEQGIGVLLVEQHVHLALTWADRAYVLAGGRIRSSGTAEELKERWAEVQASYLGST